MFDDIDQLSSVITNTPASSTVEDLWGIFKTGVKQSLDKNIPTKVCKNKKSLPWYNRGLKKMVEDGAGESISNRKAMNRNWSNQKANPALKT